MDAPAVVYHQNIEYAAHVIEPNTHNPVCYLHNILKAVPLFDTKVTTPGYDRKQNNIEVLSI